MESIRPLIRWLILSAWVWPGAGCTTLEGWKSGHNRVPPMTPPTPPTAPIQPAGSFSTVHGTDSSTTDLGTTRRTLSFSKPWSGVSQLLGKEKSRPVAEIATAWRNKIEYLPNPAANGAMQPGLAGQVFLYTADAKPALAHGNLIIDLIDETPRPPGIPPLTPERWEFKKDVLKNLRTLDERFGECYVIFLPWPTYRPDVTHIRLRVRYEPEGGGFPIYAPETRLILGASGGGISDATAAVPTPSAESPSGPGMGVFRFGGASPSSHTDANSSSAHPVPPRCRVLEITPPVRQPAPSTPAPSTTASPSIPAGTPSPVPASEKSLPNSQSFQPPHPTNSSIAPSAAAGIHPLPTPPLVPGPLPE
jgi:hypothetical protein